ncbi:GntR family transcriptional regulator [Roseicyclus sp. F158]|uniref:GntR family transcriptional regulator n=1 Tax=Tropicimonas omnivorans TaxID=3075590 RepID=A0ABU3DD18_9RHOB|nr:GntR family transcriptional regulator [Roseicyclus sp. F158]MDT0681611.1 GntR family transcriptional regulator [Roseicyclus sp. F158]
MTRTSFPEIAPVRRETVQSRIHQELRTMLMAGHFQPGQALKINDLAAAFGTSAQPIRESIRQLVAERALDATANRSARIPRLGPEQLDDLRRTRLALEGLAAELATERATEDGIAALSRIVDEELRADDKRDIGTSVAHNLNFHFTMYRMSGSEIIPPIIEGLWLRVGPHVRTAAEIFDAREGRGAELHVRSIEAMRKGDGPGTRAAIETDINRFFDLIRDMAPTED